MTYPGNPTVNAPTPAAYPSGVAFEEGASAPASTPQERQERVDDIARSLASLFAGQDPPTTVKLTDPAVVVVFQQMMLDFARTDVEFRSLIFALLVEQNADMARRVVSLERGLDSTNWRLNQLRARLNRVRRNRYPWLPFGALLGGVIGFIVSFVLVLRTRTGTLTNVINGRRILVDSIAQATLWQWLFVITVSLAGAFALGGIAAWLRRVPIADEVTAETNQTQITQTSEVNV